MKPIKGQYYITPNSRLVKVVDNWGTVKEINLIGKERFAEKGTRLSGSIPLAWTLITLADFVPTWRTLCWYFFDKMRLAACIYFTETGMPVEYAIMKARTLWE